MLNEHSYGGDLKHSGDFSNDVIFINEGGTHEQNPFEGVLMGFDQEGTPNLVEEGEVIYNDYVFSNRLKPTKKLLADGGFTDKYEDWTFAKIAEDMQKESSERPNDLISKQTLDDLFGRLTQMQEEVRMKKKQKENKFDLGGEFNKFDDAGPIDISQIVKAGQTPIDTSYTPIIDTFFSIDPKIDNFATYFANTYKNAILSGKNPNKAYRLAKKAADFTGVDGNAFNWKDFGLDLTRVGAPAAAQLAALFTNLEEPDYSQNERSLNAARNAERSNIQVSTEDITPKKVDPNYLSNMIRNQGNTLLSHYANMSSNVPQAMAYMMLANKQNQQQQADAYIQGDEANWTRGLQASEFNRGNRQLESSVDFQNFANNTAIHNTIVNETARAAAANAALDASRAQGVLGSAGDFANTLSQYATEKSWQDIIDKNPSLLYTSKGVYKNPTTAEAKYGGLLTKSKKRRK